MGLGQILVVLPKHFSHSPADSLLLAHRIWYRLTTLPCGLGLGSHTICDRLDSNSSPTHIVGPTEWWDWCDGYVEVRCMLVPHRLEPIYFNIHTHTRRILYPSSGVNVIQGSGVWGPKVGPQGPGKVGCFRR